ncbi:uncharacterized protein LOC111633553 [Centruroides sculpturatus]|uniref:uncharacterized protein LOC111633553 n=1 Tax=Centruroides sculpturatus TaxID=218467 RepID=UPI000C6D7D0A|nr:uncharacterized protein LOC111633553 [Centruroides sculpturatus]
MNGVTSSKLYFIEDFLIPALENGIFGEKLCWIDESNRIFKILWKDNRKSKNKFIDKPSEIFLAWLKMKNNDKRIIKCKDIFRSALYSKEKEKILKRLRNHENYRCYQFLEYAGRNVNLEPNSLENQIFASSTSYNLQVSPTISQIPSTIENYNYSAMETELLEGIIPEPNNPSIIDDIINYFSNEYQHSSN